MTDLSITEFLNGLEAESAEMTSIEDEILSADVSVTVPRIPIRPVARRAVQAVRQVQASRSRRVQAPRPAEPTGRRQKFCQKCGHRLEFNKKFCTECGTQIKAPGR